MGQGRRSVVSWQARACAAAASWTVRPVLELVPDTPFAISLIRRALRTLADVWCIPHPAAVVTPVSARSPEGLQVRGEWVTSGPLGVGELPPLDRGVVFYVHGSGYAVASARTHRAITTRLAIRTGRPVFACDYRLAPTHRFPAAADDVAAAFAWLLARGAEPRRTVVAGDSAGGQLALDLLAPRARGRAEPGAAGLLLLSPLVDASLARARAWETPTRRDPLTSVQRAERLLGLYLDGADLSSPRLNPTGAALRGLPPVQVHASGMEFLSEDSRHLVEQVTAEGGEAELWEWPGQLHVFQALAGYVPEASRSLRVAAAFIRSRLDAAAEDPVVSPA